MTGAMLGRIRHHWRIALAVALAIGLASALSSFRSGARTTTTPSSAAVERASISQVVQASGLLQPKLKVDIGAQLTGQVVKLHVQLGQTVKAGALLVSLDSESSRNAVEQALGALAQQTAALNRTKVELASARLEAQRQRRLLSGDATTEYDKEQADTALAKLEAEYEGQQAMLDQRRADLADRRLRLTYASVRAPIDGEVVAIAVQEGQTVSALQNTPTLLTLAQLNTMTVKARVAESEVDLISKGQAARVTTLSAKTRRYSGHVQVLQPIPERIGNGLFYNVLFDVDNADHKLLSDMTVQVELEVGQAENVPTLPIIALDKRDAEGRYSVRVVDATGKESSRRVLVGARDNERAQVLDGLKLGERVLLAPASSPASSASH